MNSSDAVDETVTRMAVEVQIEKHLLGKILTIVDASYTDVQQREAIKSLVKEKFHDQVDWLLDRRHGVASGSIDTKNE
jgi:hypothetical protein